MSIPRSALLMLGVAALALGGCSAKERLAELGEKPPMTQITDPTRTAGYQAASLPMPASSRPAPQSGSIWQPGARAFFKDQRASRTGDVLTVVIAINDNAIMNDQTQGNRGDSDKVSITNLFGLENKLAGIMDPASAVNTANTHIQNGQSQINRTEQINLRVAAEVTQVLPNGNLVIIGKQEVRVNYELRELQVTGIARITDIDSLNEISYDKIAEARISYGGRGQGTDLQQPRYGQQLLDIISPF